jgi:hypothetical protein
MTNPKNDTSAINENNIISVTEDNLNDSQKGDMARAIEEYKLACLRSFSATRKGDAVKKFDFSVPHPITTEQLESRMLDMIGQTVGQAFLHHDPIMANQVHNAVVKTIVNGAASGRAGPSYGQPKKTLETSTSEEGGAGPVQSATQPILTDTVPMPAPSQPPPVYSSTSPLVTPSAQGGVSSGPHTRWNSTTGYGMPPAFFAG